MQALTTTGARIIFGLPFLIFGLFHFMGANDMAGMVPLPGGVFWVYLTGVAHILAAIAILINVQTKLASLLLALMLLIFVLAIHLPGAMGGEQAMQEVQNILKNIGLIGGALAIAGLQHYQENKEGSSEA